MSSTQTFDGDRIIPSAAVVGERTTVETYSHRRKSFGYYPHHHRHHHYGFRLGVYYGYPYCCSISVGYPYVGYYSIYGYPYLAGYGCGFYGGFYVRFGPARLSYYSVCSGLGVHAYSYHHHHLYDCPVHGIHYYHKRDCPVCYPYGLGGTTGGYYADGSLERAEAAEGEGSEAQISLDSLKPEAEESLAAVDDPLSTLTPAKQSFALGFLAFENGDYDEAAEFFFNASIEDSNSIVPQLFLFVSLVAIGEYDYASSYLRSAIDKSNGRLIQYRFNVKKLYGEDRQSDFEAHRKLLFERAQLYPSDPDTLLLNGFLALNVEDFQQAGISALGLRDVAEAPSDRRLGEKLLDEVEVRKGLRSEESRDGGSSALKSFLENPTAESIDTLPIR